MDTRAVRFGGLEDSPRGPPKTSLQRRKVCAQIYTSKSTYGKIDPFQSITCSSCKINQESDTHLYRCPVHRAAMEDVFLDRKLGQWPQDNHTCPELACTLLEALYCEIHPSRYPAFKHRHGATNPKFRKLHQVQAYIGWSQLFQG
jgi:hypothetical protein